MADLMSGMLSTGQVMGGISAVTMGLYYLFLILIVAGVAIVAWKKKVFYRFPVKVKLFVLRNDGKWYEDEKGDKARRKVDKKKGAEVYQFKSSRADWQPPSFDKLGMTNKGKSVLYLKEIGDEKYEIIDPAEFVTADRSKFKEAATENVDRHWRNVQSEAADQKWAEDDRFKKLIDALPIILSIFGVALFFYIFGQYVAIPLMQQAVGQGGAVLEKAVEVLNQTNMLVDAQMRYMEALGITPMVVQNGTGVV